MIKPVRWIVVGFAALALSLAGTTFASASASPAPQASTPAATQAVAAVTPAQPSWCGWHPANDSHDPGWIDYSVVNVRTGQSTSCDSYGEDYYNNYVVVHCYNINSSGEEWYYIYDTHLNLNAWVIADSVLASWNPVAC